MNHRDTEVTEKRLGRSGVETDGGSFTQTLRAGVILLTLLFVSYVAVYVVLSRRGTAEWSRFGLEDGWFYVPLDDLIEGDDVDWNALNRHHVLRILFLPAHSLDVLVFGTPYPHRGGTWGLSHRRDEASGERRLQATGRGSRMA